MAGRRRRTAPPALSGGAIYLRAAAGCTVSGNTIVENGYGIVIDGGGYHSVTGCSLFFNRQPGIYATNIAISCALGANTITDNLAGILLFGVGYPPYPSLDVNAFNISGNNFSLNQAYDIVINNAETCNVQGNSATSVITLGTGNTPGIIEVGTANWNLFIGNLTKVAITKIGANSQNSVYNMASF